MQQRYYDPAIGRFLSVDPVPTDSRSGSNFNRHWYGNNNPYYFTDPDGRSVVPKGAPADSLDLINAQSSTRYVYNSWGELESTLSCNPLPQSSQTYSDALDVAIASNVEVSVGYANAVDVQTIDKEYGGAITADTASGGLAVRTTPNDMTDIGVDGSVQVDSPADKLRHEFVAHVAPQLNGGDLSGNARDLDNASRRELNKVELQAEPFDKIRDSN